jgi:hypothetical protein
MGANMDRSGKWIRTFLDLPVHHMPFMVGPIWSASPLTSPGISHRFRPFGYFPSGNFLGQSEWVLLALDRASGSVNSCDHLLGYFSSQNLSKNQGGE